MPSPRVYRANAVVLRRINLGETDKIVTLFTREKGKLNAVAKGARRPASRLAGAIELFGFCRVLLAVGQNLDVLTQAEVRESFAGIRFSLHKIAAASFVTELADHFTEERHPSEDQFDLLLSALYVLNVLDEPGLLVTAYTLQLLAAAGYTPTFARCARCHRPGLVYTAFSASMGGVLCRECRPAVKDATGVTTESIDLARDLIALELPRAARIEAEGRTRSDVLRMTRTFLAYRTDRPLKSARFLDELLAAGKLANGQPAEGRPTEGTDAPV